MAASEKGKKKRDKLSISRCHKILSISRCENIHPKYIISKPNFFSFFYFYFILYYDTWYDIQVLNNNKLNILKKPIEHVYSSIIKHIKKKDKKGNTPYIV